MRSAPVFSLVRAHLDKNQHGGRRYGGIQTGDGAALESVSLLGRLPKGDPFFGSYFALAQIGEEFEQRGIHLVGLFLLGPMARAVDVDAFQIRHPAFHSQCLLGP